MKKTYSKIDWVLSIFTLFPFCIFGADKFWVAKSFKKAWKFAAVKFLANLALVGIIWDIFDIVCVLTKTYEFDAREYFA